MNPRVVETSVVAGFIREVHVKDAPVFDAILRVFMGTLIEEFISTVSDIGSTDAFRNLIAFYDTSVLLRLLGCSGTLLRVATDELTRYLQDLGIQLSFLSGNEAEVHGILSAIVTAKDVGGEVFGETAQAIADGEISIADLRLMQNSVVEQLAGKGLFPAEGLEAGVQKQSQYQIDETRFAEFLSAQAASSHRTYTQQNLQNDAGYLATVVRLRKGHRTRDLSESKAVFVTTNKLFSTAARRYLIQERVIRGIDCPPILQVGQIATIAWLMREHKIDPAKASRELLANCYAAIKPDAEWFQNFRTAIEKIVGNLDAYTAAPENSIRIQAARRIAQDQTFGNASLIRTLNTAELLHIADKAAEEEKERIRREEMSKAETTALQAHVRGREEAEKERRTSDEQRARYFAHGLRRCMIFLSAAIFVVFAALYDKSALFSGESYFIGIFQILCLVPLVASTLDLFGFSLVKSFFNRFEEWVFKKVLNVLQGPI
jgi:hypothetical protein